MTGKTCWINVAILEDEPAARQRLRRLVENWSWDVPKPNLGDSSTIPLLWPWLEIKASKDLVFDNKNNINPLDIQTFNVKARIVACAESPEEFDYLITKREQQNNIDIILADVKMPGKEDGIQFAARWQKSKEAPVIVIVSAYEDSAVKAFDIEVADYIMKPVRGERLAQALHRALAKKANQDSKNSTWAQPIVDVVSKGIGEEAILTVSSRNKLINILVDDIIYFKSEDKYTTIRTKNKEYLSETPIKKFEELYYDKFFRVKRNCLASWKHIDGITHENRKTSGGEIRKGQNWFLQMKNIPERIDISRRMWSEISEKLNINPFIAYRKTFIKIEEEDIKNAQRKSIKEHKEKIIEDKNM